MKRSIWLVNLMALVAGVGLFGRTTPAFAAEAEGTTAARLERLERRVNEMAERQEQLIRRLSAQPERPGPMLQPGNVGLRPQMVPAGELPPVVQHPQGAKLAKSLQDMLGLLFLVGIICNILLAIWIFTDIRKRGEGSGIFVALALVAGIPTAIIYTLTRIGDKKV